MPLEVLIRDASLAAAITAPAPGMSENLSLQ